MNTSQDQIRTQFVQYLKCINPQENEYIDELCENLLEYGFCFGFSICRGAMIAVNKKDWWDKLLLLIAEWDGKPESLSQIVSLPHAKSMTLNEVFNRVLNYIISYQNNGSHDCYKSFMINDVDQYNFLIPEKKHFEILVENKILTTKSRVKFSGNFTSQQAAKLLMNYYKKGCICLIHSLTHTLQADLDIENSTFNLYNPNYTTQIDKTFSKPEDLIEEAMNIFGLPKNNNQEKSLSLEIVSLVDSKMTDDYYDELASQNPLGLLKNEGLLHIVYETPEELNNIVDYLYASSHPNGPDIIASALIKISGKQVAFNRLAQRKTDVLERLLDYAAQSPSCSDGLIQALQFQDDRGWSGFQHVAAYSPRLLSKILTLASHSQLFTTEFYLKLLELKNNENETGLQLMARCAPNQLFLYFDFLEADIQLDYLKLSKILLSKNESGSNGLHSIIQYAPQFLTRLLNMAMQSIELTYAIGVALAVRNNKGLTGLEAIEKDAPESLTLATKFISKATVKRYLWDNLHGVEDAKKPEALDSLVMHDPEGQLGIEILAEDPSYFSKALLHLESNPSWYTFAASLLNIKNDKGNNVFQQFLLHHQYKQLNQLLFAAAQSPRGAEYLLLMLTSTNNSV